MLRVLGRDKYEFFFDKFLEYFFTEKDAEFFASKVLNCFRLSFNYPGCSRKAAEASSTLTELWSW